jgi:predicted amidohydrolase
MAGFKLGIVQMRVEPGEKITNINRALAMMYGLLSKGDPQVLVLPEALPLGWTHPSARDEAEPIPKGQWCRILAQTARKKHVWICSGVIERCGDKIFNSAVLFDDRGKVALVHRKINELDIAHDLYEQGDRLSVVDTPFGRIGVMICADAFAKGQMISRTLGMMGAQIILSPCSWAVPADHDQEPEPYGQLWLDNYQPVAREFGMSIVAVSNVGPITEGPWSGRKCIGCSMVIGPKGEVAYQAPYGEAWEIGVHVVITPESRPRAWSGG